MPDALSTAAGTAGAGNIARHLSRMATLQPDRPAVICASGRDDQGEIAYVQLTFAELEARSNRLAAALGSIGIHRGLRTALMVPPSLDFFALTFALFKVGAVPVLIDPGIGLPSLRSCLAHAQPEAFIGITKAHAARALLGWARATVKIKLTVGPRLFWGGTTLAALWARTQPVETFSAIDPASHETAAILFTSGSTGTPKGAVYTHEIFNAQVDHIRALYGIEPGEMDLATFPLFALFGPALGMTAVIPEMDASRPASADPRHIVGAIQRFGISNMFGSPALINRVGRFGETQGITLPSLRRAISAGAPVPAKVLERLAAMLPAGAQVFTPYGATECLPVASIGSREVLSDTRHQTDRGAGVCVGKPVAGATVKIIRISDEPIDAWSGALELPAGEIGEIAVQAAHATRAYFNLPEATALSKIPDGANGAFYHRMGDVGYVDESERLWFCGRKAHRVVSDGVTRFSIPCEGVFNVHPRVFRTALVGVMRNGLNEPVICVELEAGVSEREHGAIRDALAKLGAAHSHTRDIHTFLFPPSFPVDVRHNAKIFREKLAVWAAGELR